MQIHGPSQVHGAQAIHAPHSARPAEAPQAPGLAAPRDQLDISAAGQMLDAIRDLPEIRHERVAQLRAAIADGSYESADKLDGALERLLDEIA
ncbi:MAG: flagellar biosynthesis anti-sigma factor FlgM [Planctomycetaceae bacterium]|nr:flagellar biosynthesis anti-sigma factor FlgM [Planctomycetaceae bacterium]